MAYHLVLSKNVAPELLSDLNPDLMEKAMLKLFPSVKDEKQFCTAIKEFLAKNPDAKPNPLWYSWISTTQETRIEEIRNRLMKRINK